MSRSQFAMSATATFARAFVILSAPLLLAGPSQPRDPRQAAVSLPAASWIEVSTDACGEIGKIGTRLAVTSAGDVAEDDDDDEWVNAWNMSPELSQVLNEWLLDRPKLATVTSGVERTCDDVGSLYYSDEPNLA